jgi:hypothetical protein
MVGGTGSADAGAASLTPRPVGDSRGPPGVASPAEPSARSRMAAAAGAAERRVATPVVPASTCCGVRGRPGSPRPSEAPRHRRPPTGPRPAPVPPQGGAQCRSRFAARRFPRPPQAPSRRWPGSRAPDAMRTRWEKAGADGTRGGRPAWRRGRPALPPTGSHRPQAGPTFLLAPGMAAREPNTFGNIRSCQVQFGPTKRPGGVPVASRQPPFLGRIVDPWSKMFPGRTTFRPRIQLWTKHRDRRAPRGGRPLPAATASGSQGPIDLLGRNGRAAASGRYRP